MNPRVIVENGIVVYSGPSRIDGEHIVFISTGFEYPSKNPKTGVMIQTWIMRVDTDPSSASINGEDYSICGDCPMRTFLTPEGKQYRECYVMPFQAPQRVWKTYRRGGYNTLPSLEAISAKHAGHAVRLGSYGDPAAIPPAILHAVIRDAKSHTAYTHQWRTEIENIEALRSIVMASVETLAEQELAQAMGWRTFRVGGKHVEPRTGEIICPASPEAGQRTTCAACTLCNGNRPYLRNGAARPDPRKNIVIAAHGRGATILDLRLTTHDSCVE